MESNPDPNNILLTLQVEGDLTSTCAASIREKINELFKPGNAVQTWTVLQLDLTSAKMIDSVGLNLIVNLLKKVQSRGARLQIAYADPNVLRTLTFTRLDKQLTLIKT